MSSRVLARLASYLLLATALVITLFIWEGSSLSLLTSGGSGTFIALGQLMGLLAANAALLQFMLMGRAGWVEHGFGLESIAKFHRYNGYATISLILVHPMLLATGYAMGNATGVISQYITFLTSFHNVIYAFIAELLFLAVVGSSIYIVRKKLAYETWYYVHIMVYAAIVLAFFHQLSVGGSFIGNPATRLYWYGLYGFVALNVAIWRFGIPTLDLVRFRFRVDRVEAETADTVSIYIRGHNLARWQSRPGQFVVLWIFTKQLWAEEHPFSVSWIPHDNLLRITTKNVGDYTAQLQALKPGTRLMVSGPYGSFTREVARTNKRLYIAGGVGITPLRSMLEEAVGRGEDCVLVYGSKTTSDIIFKGELRKLGEAGSLRQIDVLSHEKAAEHGRIDAERIKRLVPDFTERDVYVCGPPAMMSGLLDELPRFGLPKDQLHAERFALHSSRADKLTAGVSQTKPA